jgi:hypothetical protein
MYDGFESVEGSLGSIDPNIYATKNYGKKKVDKILIGTINRLIYSGFEHDMQPLVLVMAYEPAYNTIIGYNLHYAPESVRKAIIELVLKSNTSRIKKNNPLLVDYGMLKKAVPQSMGMIRRYKVVGVRIVDQYRLNEWNKVIKEKSKWQGMYKSKKLAKSSGFDFLDDVFKRYRGTPKTKKK